MEEQNMIHKKDLIISISIGLILLSLFEHSSMSHFTAEVITAFIIGRWLSKRIENHLKRYVFTSIMSYNMLGWILILIFTHDGRIVLEYGMGMVTIFSGTVFIVALLYATIGSLITRTRKNVQPQ
jgi:fucose permease